MKKFNSFFISTLQWNQIDGKTDRRSHMGTYKLDSNDRPLNPVGRTGITGRGQLGKWGPNHAADPIVTRWKRDENGDVITDKLSNKPILQFVSIQRHDTKQWAIPGVIIQIKLFKFNTICLFKNYIRACVILVKWFQ